MATLATGSGTIRDALSARGNDCYETPAPAVRALLSHVDVPNRIWEPACGPGAIVQELRASGRFVLATDLVGYGCPDSEAGRDFLMEWQAPEGVEAIVTNPPFKNAQEFVAKAKQLCPIVIMLLRLAFIESERRRPILDDGTLAGVYVFRNRLPMMHRLGDDGPKFGNAGMPFAWFVWRADHSGPAELHRISWGD